MKRAGGAVIHSRVLVCVETGRGKVRVLWQRGSKAKVEVGTSLSFSSLSEPVAATHLSLLPQMPGHGVLHLFSECHQPGGAPLPLSCRQVL